MKKLMVGSDKGDDDNWRPLLLSGDVIDQIETIEIGGDDRRWQPTKWRQTKPIISNGVMTNMMKKIDNWWPTVKEW